MFVSITFCNGNCLHRTGGETKYRISTVAPNGTAIELYEYGRVLSVICVLPFEYEDLIKLSAKNFCKTANFVLRVEEHCCLV